MQFNYIDRIRDFLTPADKPSGGKTPSRWAMVLSVVVAFALWFTFSMREEYTVPVEVPLEVVGIPDGQALEALPPSQARVAFKGEGWQLLNLTYRPPMVHLRAGAENVDILAAVGNAGLPVGVQAQSSSPRSVSVQLESRVSKSVPIELVWKVGTPRPYNLLGMPTISPDSVVLTGARSLIARISSWPTEPLHEEGVIRSFQKEVALRDSLSGLIERSEGSTLVRVRVAEFTQAERELEVRVDSIPVSLEEIRLVPEVVQATFLVPTEGDTYERALESNDFFGEIRYEHIAQDTTAGRVPVVVNMPSQLDIRDVRLEPSQVEYFLVRR